jgi:hypothetical protein
MRWRVSLHRVDPRFALPHQVNRAVVLGGLEGWRSGLASAGIDVIDAAAAGPLPDVAVSAPRLAEAARATGARSLIIEGSPGRSLRVGEYHVRRILLRPTRERPTLALPLEQEAPISYAVDRWSVVDRRWKSARMKAARILISHGRFPSWGSPLVTIATRAAGPPAFVAAARDLGVPDDVRWFLTFGQGDALSRNAFQLFRVASEEPDWVLKFARVAGYAHRFDDDERGLGLAHAAGGVVADRSPQLIGRFEVDGVHASLETAAAGKRLRDVLDVPGDRGGKVQLIERIADWILELGRLTRSPPARTSEERERLRAHVIPRWRELGAAPGLVDDLPALGGVVQHNDLGPWNVVADGVDFAVVDWENARPAAFPLWDLLYFLGHALVAVEHAASPEQLPERMTELFAGESRMSPLLHSWVRRGAEAANIPPTAVGAIATLCWMSHSLSTDVQNADLATFTPRDPPRLHGFEGMARAWMVHPALGPDWSVWRA